MQDGAANIKQIADPYANEPTRHPALITRTAKPFNAETPPDALAAGAYTPNDLFYVRNHLPVPYVDPATYSVRVCAPCTEFLLNAVSLDGGTVNMEPRLSINVSHTYWPSFCKDRSLEASHQARESGGVTCFGSVVTAVACGGRGPAHLEPVSGRSQNAI